MPNCMPIGHIFQCNALLLYRQENIISDCLIVIYEPLSTAVDWDLVAKGGIEPPTHGFSIRCSTD